MSEGYLSKDRDRLGMVEATVTQAEMAERMGVAQATVGRLESSAGSRKHAPSLATLRRSLRSGPPVACLCLRSGALLGSQSVFDGVAISYPVRIALRTGK